MPPPSRSPWSFAPVSSFFGSILFLTIIYAAAWLPPLVVFGGLRHAAVVGGAADASRRTSPAAPVGGVTTFVHVTDIHASALDGWASVASLSALVREGLPAVMPSALVVSGDEVNSVSAAPLGYPPPPSPPPPRSIAEERTYGRGSETLAVRLGRRLLRRASDIDPAEAAAVHDALAAAAVTGTSVVRTAGNHDTFGMPPGAPVPASGGVHGAQPGVAVTTVSGGGGGGPPLRLVLLDATQRPSAARRPLNFFGTLAADDVAALAAVLDDGRGGGGDGDAPPPTVVLSHYPLGTVATEPAWSAGPRSWARGRGSHGALVAALQAAPSTVAYLCGHLHDLHGSARVGLTTSLAPSGVAHLQLPAVLLGRSAPAVRIFGVWAASGPGGRPGLAWTTTSIATLTAAAKSVPAAAAARGKTPAPEVVLLLSPRGAGGVAVVALPAGVRFMVFVGDGRGVVDGVQAAPPPPRRYGVWLGGQRLGVVAGPPRSVLVVGVPPLPQGVPRSWGTAGVRLRVCRLADGDEGDNGCGLPLLDETVLIGLVGDVGWSATPVPAADLARTLARRAAAATSAASHAIVGTSDVATLFPLLAAEAVAVLVALAWTARQPGVPMAVVAGAALAATAAAILVAPGLPLVRAATLHIPAGGTLTATRFVPSPASGDPPIGPTADGQFLLLGILWRVLVPLAWVVTRRPSTPLLLRAAVVAVAWRWVWGWTTSVAGCYGWAAVGASPAVGGVVVVAVVLGVVALGGGGVGVGQRQGHLKCT